MNVNPDQDAALWLLYVLGAAVIVADLVFNWRRRK